MQLSRGFTSYAWHGPKDGQVVVLVHGLTTPSFVWEDLMPWLTGAGMRVLTYDHYGRGQSAAPFDKQNMAFFTSHLAELLDALGVDTTVKLVGYSMGGGISACFANQHPERVLQSVLIAPIGFTTELGGFAKIVRIPILGDILMAMFGPAKFRAGAIAEAKLDGASKRMTQLQCEVTKGDGFARSVLSSIRYALGPLGVTHRELAEKDIPLCAIWGSEDDVIPLCGAKKLEAINKNVHTHVIEGGRHGIAYTHSDQVGRIIARFLV